MMDARLSDISYACYAILG